MPNRPGAGRPPFGDEPLVALHVSVTAEQKAWLVEQGPNVSETVRNVVQAAMEAEAAWKADEAERALLREHYSEIALGLVALKA